MDDPDQKLKWCFLVSITATYNICTHAHMCVFKHICLLHNTFSYFFSNILGIIYLSSPLSLCITLPHPFSVKSLSSLHIYPLSLPSNYDLLSPLSRASSVLSIPMVLLGQNYLMAGTLRLVGQRRAWLEFEG